MVLLCPISWSIFRRGVVSYLPTSRSWKVVLLITWLRSFRQVVFRGVSFGVFRIAVLVLAFPSHCSRLGSLEEWNRFLDFLIRCFDALVSGWFAILAAASIVLDGLYINLALLADDTRLMDLLMESVWPDSKLTPSSTSIPRINVHFPLKSNFITLSLHYLLIIS